MATLRELRKQVKDLGLTYEKNNTIAQLQEMIAEKMCDDETPAAETPAPATTFSDEIEINEGDLNTEFKNQASKYAAFAAAEANAKAAGWKVKC